LFSLSLSLSPSLPVCQKHDLSHVNKIKTDRYRGQRDGSFGEKDSNPKKKDLKEKGVVAD